MRYKLVLPASLVCVAVLSMLCLRIPFFWDTAYFSKQANYFFVHGFSSLIPPDDLDNGGFPLYGIFMALCWKLLGRTLVVSHLAISVFLAGIVYAYYFLAKRFLKPRILPFAMLFLFLEPCLLTQSMLMTNDTFLLFFFLAGLNALLAKNMIRYGLFLVCMSLCSIRGVAATGALVLVHLFLEFKKGRTHISSVLSYVPLVICLLFWAVYHRIHSGWYLFSPLRSSTDERFLDLSGMAKQFILTGWKLADSGRIFCWVFLGWGILFLIRSRQMTPVFKRLLALLFIPLLVSLALMIPLSNPSSGRYFMPVYLVLFLAICFVFQQMKRKPAVIWFLVLAFGLISGNFWIYPERFSNGWDTSLKVLPFFQLKRDMILYVKENKLVPGQIGTRFPLIDSLTDSDLEAEPFQFANALNGPVKKFRYYLHSNVCNTNLLPQIEEIRLEWKLLKALKKGEVYMALYENPDWVEERHQTP